MLFVTSHDKENNVMAVLHSAAEWRMWLLWQMWSVSWRLSQAQRLAERMKCFFPFFINLLYRTKQRSTLWLQIGNGNLGGQPQRFLPLLALRSQSLRTVLCSRLKFFVVFLTVTSLLKPPHIRAPLKYTDAQRWRLVSLCVCFLFLAISSRSWICCLWFVSLFLEKTQISAFIPYEQQQVNRFLQVVAPARPVTHRFITCCCSLAHTAGK